MREAELMVAVNALVESIPQIESGIEEFDPNDMPPPPDKFSLPPEALAEVIGGVQQDGSASSSPQPQLPPPSVQIQRPDPAVAAITKVASSTVVSKESLLARMQLLKVSSL